MPNILLQRSVQPWGIRDICPLLISPCLTTKYKIICFCPWWDTSKGIGADTKTSLSLVIIRNSLGRTDNFPLFGWCSSPVEKISTLLKMESAPDEKNQKHSSFLPPVASLVGCQRFCNQTWFDSARLLLLTLFFKA